MVKKSCPARKKRLPSPSPPIISLGTTKLNVLKELSKGGNPHSIARKLHCSRANVQKHLRNLRDSYGFTHKLDDDICSVWRTTKSGKEFLEGNLPVVMSQRERATYLEDRPHNIKIKFPILSKPNDLIWLEGWKKNDKMKNNVFYHESFGDIQTTYTGKSLIFQLPIINFKDSEFALAEAGRIAFALRRKYESEVPGLKLGEKETSCQLISQHHASVKDPYAVFCRKHKISYRDEIIEIDASPTKKGVKVPEIEFTDSEKSHIHHQRHIDNIKDIVLDKAPTNSEINTQLRNILNLLEKQQSTNNETAIALNSVVNLLEKQYKLNDNELNMPKNYSGLKDKGEYIR